ncbi:MAG: right-handed parallel beta-helix repeat-containing protein, partial [Pirellula sp.]
ISIYYSHETIVGTNGDGTSDSFERNLISGNGYGGITINDSNQNRIAGNYIGTNTSGSESIPNYGNGVSIRGNSTGNTIGTDSSNDAWNESERNLISGNSASGIGLSSARVSNTVIAGNLIGVDVTGTQAISNSYGVYIYKAFGTRVGTDGDGNYDSLERNVVSGNSIGVVVDGDNPYVSNMEIAQDLVDGRIISTVYTAELAQADLFDTSGAAGGNWGIDLPIPGGGGENYAVKVTGTLQVATPGVYSFAAGSDDGTRLIIDGQDVAFFWEPRSFGVSYGEMNLSAGEHTIEWISFEQGGAAGFELSVSPIAGNYSDITEANGWKVLGDPNPDSQIRLKPGTVLNATAYYATGPYRFNTSIAGNFLGTDINGNTSVPNTYGIFIYNSAEIEIGGPIASMRNMISGNSQSGIYAQGTYLLSIEGNSIGLDKDGQNPIGNVFFGLELLGANDTLIKNNIIGSNVRGLQIQSAKSTVVVGNTIGLAADGITQRSNTQGGLVAVYSSGMQLGTDGDGIDDALEGNLISANGGPANVALIFVNDSVVAGNTIGSTKDYALVGGTLPNSHGIYVLNSNNVTIGTDALPDTFNLSERNVIGGNLEHGIAVAGSNRIKIAGNLVGIAPSGSALPNQVRGVSISDSTQVLVGTDGDGQDDAIEGNVISGNKSFGLVVEGYGNSLVRVSGNKIGTNIDGTQAVPNEYQGIFLM